MVKRTVRCLRIRSIVPLLALLSSSALAASDAAWPAYRWEALKIYRYEIVKRAQTTTEGQTEPRVTEITCVLVFEVSAVDKEGNATAEVRYATPRVTLPALTYFDPGDNERKQDTAHPTRVARAMETILSETRWPVTLAPNGSIRLREKPTDWRNWMERVEQAGRWPKRLGNELTQLLNTHFSLSKDESPDDEWLPVLRNDPPGARVSGLRAFRPRRVVRMAETNKDGFMRLSLSRIPEEQPTSVDVPLLDTEEVKLTLTREAVKSQGGEGIFDTQLGLLDRAKEQFQVRLLSRCGNLERRSNLDITYSIKRLAPDLRKSAEDADGATGARPARRD